MTLCREVYHCGPSELAEKMSLSELRLWRQFYAREGTWDQRADIRQAITSHTVANQAGYEARLRRHNGATFKEFLPKIGGSDRPKTGKELHAKLTAFAAMMGAKGKSDGINRQTSC